MQNILYDLVFTIIGYLKADWLILLIGILLAVGISVYVDPKKMRKAMKRNSRFSIGGAVAFGAFTPLCACGTMAVMLSMFAATLPWGPVIAFLVSSPLTSPSEFMFESAFFGSTFAIAVLVSSIFLGVAAGVGANFLDKKTEFFKGQIRQREKSDKGRQTPKGDKAKTKIARKKLLRKDQNLKMQSVTVLKKSFVKRYKLDEFLRELWQIGVMKILLFFVAFIAIGRLVEIFVPTEWIMSLFGDNNGYSIPLSATIGLPLYVSGSAALPLMKSFVNAGAGQGAILAFLIAGKATGIPVIAGLSIIIKRRAMLYYVLFTYLGAMLCGYIYQIFLNFSL